MAGSYRHCTKDDGTFEDENFTVMIENLGDALEACENMHFMIKYLSGGDERKIKEAEEAYYANVRQRGYI